MKFGGGAADADADGITGVGEISVVGSTHEPGPGAADLGVAITFAGGVIGAARRGGQVLNGVTVHVEAGGDTHAGDDQSGTAERVTARGECAGRKFGDAYAGARGDFRIG